MKRKLSTFWAVLLIAMLVISPAGAGGVSVKWGQGSLTIDGEGWGFSRGLVEIVITATGMPMGVTCTPEAEVNAPEPVLVVVSTIVSVDKNGHFNFDLVGVPDFSDPTKAGCPEGSIAEVDWVNWTHTSIKVTDSNPERPTFGQVLFFKQYTCISTEKTVDCTAVKGKG